MVQKRVKFFLDEELVTKIANETGGKYYRAHNIAGLKDIYSQIDALEKSEVEIHCPSSEDPERTLKLLLMIILHTLNQRNLINYHASQTSILEAGPHPDGILTTM